MTVSRGRFFLARALRRQLRTALSKGPGFAVASLLVAGIVFASLLVALQFGEVVGAMGELRDLHRPQRGGELAGRLFNELVRGRRLAFDPRSSRLTTNVDCKGWNAGFPAPGDVARTGSPPDAAADTMHNALARFCQSDIGEALRSEIDAWNATVSMVAVRDDWDRQKPCRNGTMPQGYIPTGCHPADAWSGAVAIGPQQAQTGPRGGEPPPDLFGFLAIDQHPGFGDWIRFDAAGLRSTEGAMTLERGFGADPSQASARASGQSIAVDVVGDVDRASWRDENDAVVQSIDTGRLYCAEAGSDDACRAAHSAPEGGPMPRAHRISLDIPAGVRGRLAIEVRPISVAERSVVALAKAAFRLPGAYERPQDAGSDAVGYTGHVATVKLTRHIEVQCVGDHPADAPIYDDEKGSIVKIVAPDPGTPARPESKLVCALLWDAAAVDPPPSPLDTAPDAAVEPAVPRAAFAITADRAPEKLPLSRLDDPPSPQAAAARGGVETPRVIAAAETAQLGLIPVVGFDDHDTNGLLALLRQKAVPGGSLIADLTIDADLQKAAFGLVGDLMAARPEFKEEQSHLPAEQRANRRVAIVLLDAGALDPAGGFDEDTGRILAAATWPQVNVRLSEWDLIALDEYHGARHADPVAARGWAKSDRFNAPGSTFKPLIALAAIDKAARGDEDLARMLGAEPDHPGLDRDEMNRGPWNTYNFAWDSNILRVPTWAGRRGGGGIAEIHNDNDESISAAAVSHGKDGARVALPRAMALSNNLWFARLALAIDENAVSAPDIDGRRVEFGDTAHNGELAVARILGRLWPKEARGLMDGFSPALRRDSRLVADPILISETDPGGPRLYNLALNGFGQGGAQATPLALASIMASIATGRIVEPRLTPLPDPQATLRGAPIFDEAPVGGRPLDTRRAAVMLETLRGALADVVRQPGGTAFNAFKTSKGLADRLSGKTGTAQIGSSGNHDLQAHLNTVWFEGWLDGLKNSRYGNRRLAFTCMVSHADRGDHTAGGSVCAPLMRKLFERIEAGGTHDAAALDTPLDRGREAHR